MRRPGVSVGAARDVLEGDLAVTFNSGDPLKDFLSPAEKWPAVQHTFIEHGLVVKSQSHGVRDTMKTAPGAVLLYPRAAFSPPAVCNKYFSGRR